MPVKAVRKPGVRAAISGRTGLNPGPPQNLTLRAVSIMLQERITSRDVVASLRSFANTIQFATRQVESREQAFDKLGVLLTDLLRC
jgi:hypothetical protein